MVVMSNSNKDYSKLYKELVRDEVTDYHFCYILDLLNLRQVDDSEFIALFRLSYREKNVECIINDMVDHNRTLLESMTSYIINKGGF